MNELPPWLIFMSEDPLLRQVFSEIMADDGLRAALDSAAAPEGRPMFGVQVGGRPFLEQLNSRRPRDQQIKLREGVGGVSMFNSSPDSAAYGAGLVLDLDRIRAAAQGDSARTHEMVRDAALHELAHILPVAQSRHMRDMTGDPKPGDPNAAQHPAIQGENQLRGLLGLPSKAFYGLLGKR